MKKNNSPVQAEEKKLLKPKNDVVFQSIFNQNTEKITKAFVEALLDEKITKMTINSDQILVRNTPDDKLGILDLELDINNNKKVDIEISSSKEQILLSVYFSTFQDYMPPKLNVVMTTQKLKK